MNKRVALALLSRSYPDVMDVGLHEVLPELLPEGNREALAADLCGLLFRPFVPVDTWGKFAVQLSIDGHGTTGRLPVQYLQGTSVTLKMKSPFQDWYDDMFRPGEHYETFRYDLTDVVERSKELLDRFEKSDASLSSMAKHASDTAVNVFNFFGQLDALVYAALKVKEVCPWEVKVPPAGEWEILVLDRGVGGRNWRSPTIKAPWAEAIRESIHKLMARNLPPATSEITGPV